ncbi:MAG: hypothetical protein K5694_04075, partial [Bacilli bacterium]|nr:hypothetical protein [Bacilli bacterium]
KIKSFFDLIFSNSFFKNICICKRLHFNSMPLKGQEVMGKYCHFFKEMLRKGKGDFLFLV